MEENIKCKDYHVWPNTTENMEGIPCQCGKFLWHEEACGCPGESKKEFTMLPNPNYRGDDN